MKKKGLLIGLFLIILFPLSALDGIELRFGQQWYGNGSSNPVTPSPLKSTLGLALPFRLSDVITFYPEINFSTCDFIWDSATARAVPAEPSTIDRMVVLQVLLDPSFVFLFPVGERSVLGFGASAAFYLRFPLFGYDNGESNRSFITSYFYKAGRFIYPSLGPEYHWAFSDKMKFRVSARLYWPLHHLWDGEGLPVWDQMIVTLRTGFQFFF